MTFPKEGRVRLPAFLSWVRRRDCRAAPPWSSTACKGETEAHHFPPKGMGGATLRDDRTIPLCRVHHDQAQRYEIPAETQELWVHETRSRFLDSAEAEDLRAYFLALVEMRERPLMIQF